MIVSSDLLSLLKRRFSVADDVPTSDELEHSGDEEEEEEYDGPRLGEMVKFSVLFGPEGGIGAWPADEGAIYVTPNTAYQYRNGEWVDVEADTENLFRSVATYVDPQEIRRQQQR